MIEDLIRNVKVSELKFTPANLLKTWRKLKNIPGGKTVFSQMLGLMAPYTGTVGCHVEELAPGKSVVTMKDRRKVRNHLKSIHAIAQVNLAEVSTGLPLICGLSKDSRGILVGFKIEYLKKARGTLTARADFEPTKGLEEMQVEIESIVKDSSGDVVSKAMATWKVGPNKK